MLYRIYTQDKYRMTINRILREHGIDGYTLISSKGMWKGVREDSIVIEIASDVPEMDGKVRNVAEQIRAENGQESVLVVSIPANVEMVTGEREGIYA